MSDEFEKQIENVDEGRRKAIRRLAATAWTAPVLTSFTMAGSASVALAQVANSS